MKYKKLYSYRINDIEIKKAKGVKKHVRNKHMKFSDYMNI